MAQAARLPGEIAPLHPIAGPGAWYGEGLQNRDDWVQPLSEPDISEIMAAVTGVIERGLDIVEVSKAAFPLPRLGKVLAERQEEIVNGCGFIMLRGLPVDRMSRREAALAFWGIGLHLGQPVSQNLAGHVLGHVKDIGGDFDDPNSRAGYQSRARLPYHTDLGADIVGLLCLQAAERGGLSSLVSAATIHNEMLSARPDLVEALAKPIYRDRRGEIPPGKSPYFQAPVFCYHAGYMTTTFVRRFIDTAPRHAGVPPLTPELIEALELYETLANDLRLRLDMAFEPGDMQFINNLTLLHSRTAFADNTDATCKRHLLRLWLVAPNGWPLPAAYYERFGTAGDGTRPAGMIGAGVKPIAPLDVV